MPKRYGDFWSKVQHGDSSSCWLWLGATTGRGYGIVSVGGKTTTAHRVAFTLSGGVIGDGHVVMHSCDNPPCCNPRHLSSGTQQKNIADMWARGRAGDCRVFGEAHGGAKLTDADVERIHALRKDGFTQTAIAERFGVAQTHVSRILRGENRLKGAA